MRNLLIVLLILCACACNGQVLRFSQPMYDDTVLPDASTTVMLHFDGDFADLGGGTWAPLGGYPHTFGAAKYGSASAMATIQAGSGWYSQLKSTNATAATTLGTSDFTVEFWGKASLFPIYGFAYGADITVGQVDILSTITPYKNAALKFGGYAAAQDIDGSGVPKFASFTPTISYSDTDGTATSASIIEEDSLNLPQWHHVCFERRSGTLYGYIDGLELFVIACSFDISTALQATLLSDYTAGALAGYLFVDDLRIKKGGYVYGGAFTPPTRAIGIEKPMEIKFSDPMIDTTQLPDASSTILLHFDGNFSDLGGSTWNNTTFGAFDSAVKKFGSYSCKTGTSGFLQSSTATKSVAVGTGDFTCEYWLNAGNISGPTDAGSPVIKFRFYNGGTGYFTGEAGFFKNSETTFVPAIYATGYFFSPAISGEATQSYLITENKWFHFCFERRSGVLYAYIDGKLIGSANMAGDYTTVSGVDITRVSLVALGMSGDFFIDELRFFKKGYVYGGEFTPPIKPFGLKKPMNIKF